MHRRGFIKAGAAAALMSGAAARSSLGDVPVHRWEEYDFGCGPLPSNRLNQGPFGIDQDEGWYTIATTTPSDQAVRNYGLGMMGYTWEENGPSLAARQGTETLEQHVEKLASLPFVDILYIRCDWRDVQNQPGRLNLHPIWKLTRAAARSRGLRMAFRIQLSSPNIQPRRLSMPDYLQEKVPLVKIGRDLYRGRTDYDFVEPRYDHPEFQKAFRELNELLASELDVDPLVEFMDLMMYGFWGEGHTSNLPNPFPDYLSAEKTFAEMTRVQLETWKKVALVVNTQPDISKVGNHEIQDLAVRAGCWLRSDSVILDEPIQVEMMSYRPSWLAAVLEDGGIRHYTLDPKSLETDSAGVTKAERTMLNALDMGANYWSLWTEGEKLKRYHERFPRGFVALQRRLGYRIRPAWVWQRKRFGTTELIVAFANDGVAGVPGILYVTVESEDGKVLAGGGLDAGQPRSGRVRQASFVMPVGWDGKKVRIRAEIESKGKVRHPVRWACAQPLNGDASLTVQLIPNNHEAWRKGI
jgi:hypothetical protein